ncbi:MAG TPA: glycosyltransferase family 9 protein, partial [Propionibacteriaceae bacterium]|nr:glycosyltransferase family 9 protein [Propionibacteriaceae bacterium]
MAPTVLMLRVSGLRDQLAAIPAMRAVRRACPDHQVILAAPNQLGPLLELSGAFDQLLPTAGLAALDWHGSRPSLAVNLHGPGPKSHRVLQALDPGKLVAFRNENAGTNGPDWRANERDVDRWCRLVATMPGCCPDPDEFRLPPPASTGLGPVVVLHPGAASQSMRWSLERMARAGRWLLAQSENVLVTGSPRHRDRCARLCHLMGLSPAHDLSGRTSLIELAEIVATCRLLVSNDTGVSHLATAFGIPSVTITGLNSPNWAPRTCAPHTKIRQE